LRAGGGVSIPFNADQRFARLAFQSGRSAAIWVTAPSSPNLSLPGYYLLFILNEAGVPSVARIVRIC
jgi:hypothetical protein